MPSEAALGDLSDFHEEFTLKRLFVTQDSVFSSLFGYFVRWKLFGLSLDCLVCWPSYCALVEQCHALVRVRWNNWYLSINNHNSSIVLLVFYLLQLVSSCFVYRFGYESYPTNRRCRTLNSAAHGFLDSMDWSFSSSFGLAIKVWLSKRASAMPVNLQNSKSSVWVADVGDCQSTQQGRQQTEEVLVFLHFKNLSIERRSLNDRPLSSSMARRRLQSSECLCFLAFWGEFEQFSKLKTLSC